MSLLLCDVTLTYPDGDTRLIALDGVDLDVSAGTITAVTGPSGSGKSGLLAAAATPTLPTTPAVDHACRTRSALMPVHGAVR